VEADGRSLILPDYSGNLFYTTLGDIESDGLCGLTFPNFETGDILYVTGDAENLFGDAANIVMPRQNRLTRVMITGYTHVEGGLNLISTKTSPSPYNPPIKYLASELSMVGKGVDYDARQQVILIDAKQDTKDITTFTFQLKNRKVDIRPGQHVILDLSSELDHGYMHMNDDDPQSVNDDFIRSWTISSIPDVDSNGNYLPSDRFSCTIKKLSRGAASTHLHSWARRRDHLRSELAIKYVGAEGEFSCFDEGHRLKYDKLLFIAGGVGITPFLTMLEVFKTRNIQADVILLFSARGDETSFAERFKEAGMVTKVFNTKSEQGAKPDADVFDRRLEYDDISQIPDLQQRGVYICGPDGFMQTVRIYLERAGARNENIHSESFAF
jgi:uncharacterized protein